jgi:hypothetical protein
VEPLTGRVIRSAKRLQANFRLQASDFSWGASPLIDPRSDGSGGSSGSGGGTASGMYAGLFAQSEHAFHPFYIQEEVEVASADLDEFKSNVLEPRKWAHRGTLILVIVGAVGTAAAVLVAAFACLQPIKPKMADSGSDLHSIAEA